MPVQDLPIQVAELDCIMVNDSYAANAGGGQIDGSRRPEPASTGDEHAGLLELLLPFLAEALNHYLPVIPFSFLSG
jgi:hypothetical protein